jgi:DNA (cytosine-5)-methyltransferase 1
MSAAAVAGKIARLRAGAKPRVLDLFAGCGGLSLGFHRAGFEIRAAVESDPEAVRSHATNFHPGDSRHAAPRNIVSTHPQDLAAELDLGPVPEAFDILVGGPPCQAFARVGRPKLREIEEHPEAFRHDPRARLYEEYLRYIDAFQPLAVLIENVPDVLNHGGQNIAQEICDVLQEPERNYVCGYTLLNAAFYGVPQMRERMFLIAYRREFTEHVQFPAPTHWVVLPPGYEGSRQVALKMLNGLFRAAHDYVEPPAARQDLTPAVTAEQALADLPPIYARQEFKDGKLRRGARRFDEAQAYGENRPGSPFASLMRTWPGFEAPSEGVRDHVIRYLPRDYALFARLKPGDQYPEAHQQALQMLKERIDELQKAGTILEEASDEYRRLRDSIVPPYDAGKFPNKWRKMWRDQPARTLMAHLGKDSYSHIHYDSDQARTISVREAARLQSFPDGFVFCGTMNPAFRQIGNAVPPLLAKALAGTIMAVLKGTGGQVEDVITSGAAAAV